MTLKLCPQIEYQIKNIFLEKSCRKWAEIASPRPLYNFGKYLKRPLYAKKKKKKKKEKTKNKQKQHAKYIVFITVRKNEIYSTHC